MILKHETTTGDPDRISKGETTVDCQVLFNRVTHTNTLQDLRERDNQMHVLKTNRQTKTRAHKKKYTHHWRY